MPDQNTIPNYALYGEADKNLFPDFLHIEAIRARSEKIGGNFRPHRHHNLFQFFYIESGSGDCQIDGKTYDIRDQALIVIPPVFIHGFCFAPKTKGWVLSVPESNVRQAFADEATLFTHICKPLFIQNNHAEWQTKTTVIYTSLMQVQSQRSGLQKFAQRSLSHALFHQILLTLPIFGQNFKSNKTTDHRQSASVKTDHVQNFQSALDENFKTRKTVAQYASDLGITPTHLNRICKANMQLSASHVIDNRSLLEAKRLLIYTAQTSSEIAYELGFCDPAHFSKFFQNKSGQTPSNFRKEYIAKV